jgi:hypothetical protein
MKKQGDSGDEEAKFRVRNRAGMRHRQASYSLRSCSPWRWGEDPPVEGSSTIRRTAYGIRQQHEKEGVPRTVRVASR